MPMLLLASPLALIGFALAQAGGGGSFSGSGGGSGGGGFGDSGGEGVGWIIYMLFRLIMSAPLVGIPLTVFILFVMFKSGAFANSNHKRRTIHRAQPTLKSEPQPVSFGALLERDPSFNPEDLMARVGVAFHKAQDCWCEQDLGALMPFVSDGVYERFSLQVEDQREAGWRQVMEGTKLGHISYVDVQSDSNFDSLTLRLPFSSKISRANLSTGKAIAKSRVDRTSFTECWTFVRRRGAKSLVGPGLIEGQCPNCGATLAINQTAICGTCGCQAKSGEFDWVLTEITQSSVWSSESAQAIPGLMAYQERDPGLSHFLLEDRASVAFWRKCAADKRGATEPLQRVGTAEFCSTYKDSLQAPEQGARKFLADCAVGSVRTLGVSMGQEFDLAVVEVHWDGRRAELAPDGELKIGDHRHLHRTAFIFERKTGQSTILSSSLTTASCRNCGANDTGGTSSACPYCEAPRTGSKDTWLLRSIDPIYKPQVLGLLSAIPKSTTPIPTPATRAPSTLLEWAVSLSLADNKVSVEERRALSMLAERSKVSNQELDAMLRMGLEGVPSATPKDEQEARNWLEQLVQIALADGILMGPEQRYLELSATKLGIERSAFKRLVNRVRDDLYQRSKSALKAQKGKR